MIWFDRFYSGILGLIFLGLVGWLAWTIVHNGFVLYALLFVIAALSAGYVMEKLGGRL